MCPACLPAPRSILGYRSHQIRDSLTRQMDVVDGGMCLEHPGLRTVKGMNIGANVCILATRASC